MDISKPLIVKGEKIKTIIFDWGGVIVNIDFMRSVEAFKKLGLPDLTSGYVPPNHIELFDLLELGEISPADFRKGLCSLEPGVRLTDEQFDKAWSALLLDTPTERIQLLQHLNKKYNLLLLSNTNKIHFDLMKLRYKMELGLELERVFKKLYLSHELHLRKPSLEIFRLVLEENNLQPSETLFIDDTEQHILAAQKLNIVTHHLKLPQTINELFDIWL